VTHGAIGPLEIVGGPRRVRPESSETDRDIGQTNAAIPPIRSALG
jgi:hypothetical protein